MLECLLAIIIMLLMANIIDNMINNNTYRRYIKKQEYLLDDKLAKVFTKDLEEISEMLKNLKNEREDK